ncbi:MAG: acetyl-CoA C-acetyltransferase [Candidatus Eremiobacteraeota bacterium]|nr:acetyl-CoA C-acetyltransferase [Candidatus Eremiobacteraeota bacterium]
MTDLSVFSIPDLEPQVKKTERKPAHEAVIVSAVRTAIGKFSGTLREVHPAELGALCIKEAVGRAGLAPEEVDEVIMGNVVSAGLGQNPARQAAIKAGLPVKVGAMTLNKVCASGLKSVVLAAQAVSGGDAEAVVAGGMESMSRTPYLITKARSGIRMGHDQIIDSMIADGLWDPYHDFHMGFTGEIVAHHFNVSRGDQDEYAFRSHQKAVEAINRGKFNDEIVAVPLVGKKGEVSAFSVDESPRADTTVEKLASLRPAFLKEGTVTAGNSPGVNDGAAALLVMAGDAAASRGMKPIARIVNYFTSGLAPEWVMLTPIPAIRGVLAKNGGPSLGEIDLFEINEAFSVQALACIRELAIDQGKVNINGGAVALGHPIGASGARILVTLLHGLRARGGRYGIASLCLGGGNGVAVLVEML